MRQNEFAGVRSFLGAIRSALGEHGIISCSWNGDVLVVTHAIPETCKQMYAMTFDSPMEDYSADANALIFEFAKQSAAHFAPQQDEDAA